MVTGMTVVVTAVVLAPPQNQPAGGRAANSRQVGFRGGPAQETFFPKTHIFIQLHDWGEGAGFSGGVWLLWLVLFFDGAPPSAAPLLQGQGRRTPEALRFSSGPGRGPHDRRRSPGAWGFRGGLSGRRRAHCGLPAFLGLRQILYQLGPERWPSRFSFSFFFAVGRSPMGRDDRLLE